MKFSLGTAQFGMNYGINNHIGKITTHDAKKIIKYSRDNDISFIDTAMNYGPCEEVLGEIGINDFNIITKISEIPNNISDIDNWIEKKTLQSLRKLKVNHLYGLLLHDVNQLSLKKGPKIFEAMNNLKSKGIVKKIGISVYDPNDLELFYHYFHFDLVQSPMNIIDQRLVDKKIIKFLKKNNVEIHTRSIFLQGLFFMHKQELNKLFYPWKDIWKTWFSHLKKFDISPLELCLFFQSQFQEIDRVTIGINNLNQIKEIINVMKNLNYIKLPKIKSDDKYLIDPRYWKH